MSYQVLARKWRPATFDALRGQEHVLQALRHALDSNRLHHAYLFTGTRGVGKTTIARILARCLNCETGVSASPCGACSSCVEIAEGRSVDLIEVDAASRTKVEDTRELIDNVPYAPTRSRYKVYLIDEVHMLSGHSFNALLKTLEEPPEHVKFLLATTDPQKLPATVLSRCLQFNLKNLSAERVVAHLKQVLGEERVECDEAALWALGRAAAGSMRDALSLTEQAIAFGGGELREADVVAMLGVVDRRQLIRLAQALVAENPRDVLKQCADLAEQGVDFAAAVDEFCTLLHRIAVQQVVPGVSDPEFGEAQVVHQLAAQMTAEDVQLFYTLLCDGRDSVTQAADPRAAFEMLALRLLAFRPVTPLDPELRPEQLAARAEGEAAAAPKKPKPPSAAAPVSPVAPLCEHRPPEGGSSSAAAVTPAAALSPAALVTGVVPITPAAAPPAAALASAAASPHEAAVTRQAPPPSPTAAPLPAVATPAGSATPAAAPISVPAESSGEGPPAPRQPAPPQAEPSQPERSQPAPPQAEPSQPERSQPTTSQPTTSQAEPSQPTTLQPAPSQPAPSQPAPSARGEWHEILDKLALTGSALNVASHCELLQRSGSHWALRLDERSGSLLNARHRDVIAAALAQWSGESATVAITPGEVASETPAARRRRQHAARQVAAEREIRDDPRVHKLLEDFQGRLLEGSVVVNE